MSARAQVRVDAIKEIGKFGIKNAKDWTPDDPATATPGQRNAQALFQQLNKPETGSIAQLDGFSTGQQTGSDDFHGGVTSKATLRDGINAEMKDWNETVATIADTSVPKRPELMDGFRLPHGVADDVLQTKALAFMENVKPLEQEFIDLGYEEDFIEQFGERVTAFGKAKEDKQEGLQGQKGSKSGFDAVLADALAVRKKLLIILENLYKKNPVQRAAWDTASHIERIGKPSKKTPTPTPTPSPKP